MLKPGVNRSVEPLSSEPVAKPLRLRIPTQSERIMEYVRYEQMRAQESRDVESFEEADDFEIDDGEEWFSPYEEIFEAAPEPEPEAAPPAPAPGAPTDVPREDP